MSLNPLELVAVIERSSYAMAVVRLNDHRFVWANAAYCRMLNLRRAQLLKRTWMRVSERSTKEQVTLKNETVEILKEYSVAGGGTVRVRVRVIPVLEGYVLLEAEPVKRDPVRFASWKLWLLGCILTYLAYLAVMYAQGREPQAPSIGLPRP